MIKNRLFFFLLIFSIWISILGFYQPSQNPITQPLSIAADASFGKIYPVDKATSVPATSLTLQWSALEGYGGTVIFRYCLQTAAECPGGGWLSAGSNTSVTVTDLAPNTTFYWWVRAYDSQNQLIASADNDIAWSFTTMSLPGFFNKITPANQSVGWPANNLQLSWGTSSNADYYEYCLDTTNNAACDTSWIKVISGTSVIIPVLYSNAVYYWQVRAVNGGGSRQADGGWWQFTTQVLPGIFGKLSPSNNATDQPANGLMISWEISSIATSYEYCLSLTYTPCAAAGWKNVSSITSADVGVLLYNTNYYWQVRAVNASGSQPADNGAIWQFTTAYYPHPKFYLPVISR